jgi:hypothetical protein
MIGGISAPGAGSQPDDVQLEVRRVATRLAALGPARLTRAAEDGATPADRVRPVLQDLADRAADLEGEPRRSVPVLAPHALADQLVVLVGDLLAAAGEDAAVLEHVHRRLVDLRRAM